MTGASGRLVRGLAILAAWTLLALCYLPQTYLLNLRSPTPLSLGWAFVVTAALFYVWAALTPLVLWLGRRFPFERGAIGAPLAIHLVAGIAVSALHLALLWIVNQALAGGIGPYRPPVPVAALVVGYGATNVMIYWGVVAAGQAFEYFRRYQDREFRLVEAQLQALRTQLHPHFLFNTLNAIAELIHQDPSRAEQTLTRLSDLLRLSLARTDEDLVTLGEELQFLQSYLEVQQILLQDRLRVEWTIGDDTLRARVPTMILQPLVENAVRHGIGPRVSGGCIRVSSARHGDRLHLAVEDDGVGLAAAAETSGIGLANTRARLQHLHPGDHRFDLGAGPAGGAVATLDLPFHDFAP